MFLPYLKKVKRAHEMSLAKRKAIPDAAPRRRVPEWKTETAPVADVPKAAAVHTMPDEGIRAVPDMQPMPTSAPKMHGRRNRELRRALVWSEILKKKY